MDEATFWATLAVLVASVVAAAGVWSLVASLRKLREEASRLSVLEELDQKLARLVAERRDLDLRRIEHAILELRDAQRRQEDAFLSAVEGRRHEPAHTEVLTGPSDEAVGERVTNRLLSLGYERVQIVTRKEKLAELARRDGEVLVEARRDGVLYKGRASLRAGRITDVELNPAYSIFP